MTVIKNKDINWKTYIRELALSPSKMSDIERVEMSGYLLRRDMNTIGTNILNIIFKEALDDIGYFLTSFLIAESPDSTEDLLINMRTTIVNYYSPIIDKLLISEIEDIEHDEKVTDHE